MDIPASFSRFGSQGTTAQLLDINLTDGYPMDHPLKTHRQHPSLSPQLDRCDGGNMNPIIKNGGQEPDQVSLCVGDCSSMVEACQTVPLGEGFASEYVQDPPEFSSNKSVGSTGECQFNVLDCERKLVSVKMWRECFSGFAGIFAAHVLFSGAFDCAAAAVCNLFIFILYAFAMVDKKAPTYFLCAASTSIYFFVVCLSLSVDVRGFEPFRGNEIMKNAAACETVILACAVAVGGVLGFKTMSLHRDLRRQTLYQHAKRIRFPSAAKILD